MKKIKIAILVEIINYHSGARAPLEIAKHLTKYNHDISVYAYDSMLDKNTKTDLLKYGIKMVTIKKNAIPFIGKYFSIFTLFKKIKEDKSEVICFAGTLPFFLASKLTGIPIILTYYGSQLDAYLEKKLPNEKISKIDNILNNLGNYYIYIVNYILVHYAKYVIAISKFSANEARKLYGKAPDKIIYLGSTLLSNDNKTKKHDKNQIKIISVSRITPYKGFHFIIDALKNITDNKKITLTIIGSTAQKKYLEYLKKKTNVRIKILLNPPDATLAKLYQESDFYVNADKYLYFGLPILEAAHFLRPTVSLNIAAASELIQHKKTGFIAEDVKEFSDYISLLIQNTGLRERLGKNAKKVAEKFSWEKCASEWEKVIQKIILTK